jgi:kinesin family protein 3/17
MVWIVQVDFVKELLLKQRDIMIALTQRLCERDEQILALQACRTTNNEHSTTEEECHTIRRA